MKCCDLSAGKLRTPIVFERETRTPDGGGGFGHMWSSVATVRAYVKPLTGNERLNSMRLEANVSHRIFIRYRSDLLTSDRINLDGRLMQVRAILNLEERGRWLEIHAQEGVVT